MKNQFFVGVAVLGTIGAFAVAGAANASSIHLLATATPSPSPSVTNTDTGTPSPDPTITESPSPEPTDGGGEVTADIYFDINYASDAVDPPLYSEVFGVVVNGEVELASQNVHWGEGEDEFCTLPSVDIAADLSAVTVTGNDDRCQVQVASLAITLHGSDFGTVTLGDDGLFSPIQGQEARFNGSGGGMSRLSGVLHFALLDTPTLQDYGVSGPNFGADWAGTGHGLMTGMTAFEFAVGADGAEPVAGEADFTG